ncbi:MAG: hypothetical protein WD269_02135 [Acidimicrobiia bacterium]
MLRRGTTALMAAGLLVVSACAGGDDGGGTTAPQGTTGPGSSAPAGGDGVTTANTDLGTILVDPDGRTMYVFTQDTEGESTCYDDCAALWPSVPADAPIGSGLDASLFGSTTRTDGASQLTLDGQPLYIYTPDTAPGDTLGQGFGGVWFVVGADGAMIGGPEAAQGGSGEGRTPVDYGDDY